MYDGKIEAYIFLSYVSMSGASCGQNLGAPLQYRAREQAADLLDSRLLTRAVLYPSFFLALLVIETLRSKSKQPRVGQALAYPTLGCSDWIINPVSVTAGFN